MYLPKAKIRKEKNLLGSSEDAQGQEEEVSPWIVAWSISLI